MAEALRTFVGYVVRVARLSPRVVRLTFGGGDLEGFRSVGPDQFLYVLLPPPAHPDRYVDGSFSWEAWFTTPEEDRPVGAYYTVRQHRPGAGELDMDLIVHGHGNVGPWADRAAVGDRVGLWGPRTTWAPPAGTDRVVLVADHTGIFAAAGILAGLPSATKATAVLEVPDADEHIDLPTAAELEVRWVHSAEPGLGTGLVDAVRAVDPVLDASTYVWGGGESRAMSAVRRFVRQERGMERGQVDLVAYWRHADHADDPADDA